MFSRTMPTPLLSGEKWMGAGLDVDDLVLLTLGTGIGGGIISGGKVLHELYGEWRVNSGHITVVPNTVIPAAARQSRDAWRNTPRLRPFQSWLVLSGLGDITSEECFHLAQNLETRRPRAVFLSMGEALGLGLAMLVNIFNYPLYLVGGGAVAAWDQFAPHMLAEIRRRSLTFRATETRIEKATLGSEAGLFGAAYLPRMNPASVRA